jgi:L-iditol 2-dehydrogenase
MLELFVNKPMDLEMKEVDPLEMPQDDEVKLKIKYGGICGSDISLLKGKFAHATFPIRPGHELVGTIVECGEKAQYKVGTRVVVLPNTYCGECEFCEKGRTNICVNKKSLGINMDGGFAEEYIISSKFVLPIPDEVTDERAVLIEPFAVVVSAFKKVKIKSGTSVAIVGSGNIGLLAATLAMNLGADVTAIDINPKKHDLSKKIGNFNVVYPDDVKDEKFEVVIEAVGTEETLLHATQLMKAGGSLVVIGIVPEAKIPMTQIVRNDQTIFGSIIYSFPEDYEKTIEYLKDPNLNISPILSKIVPCSDYKQAYEDAQSGNYAKVVLDFEIK